MISRMIMKKSVVVIVSALAIGGCIIAESPQSEINRAVLTETEKSTVEKGMENQPEVSYWFPDELLVWNFDQDPDAKFNVSTEPLAKRVKKTELVKSNATQQPDFKVVALSILNSSTSGNSPRGTNSFDANVFSNWQYIDEMVYWGGSSAEGIIVPPSADVIDAAHKNGVPILGTIFFPQTAHGGKIEWLESFLDKDANGQFPIVDKLIEVADSYGFDGWFINQETDTEVTSFDEAATGNTQTSSNSETGLTKEHATLMQELIAEFKEKTGDELRIMWYDSMTSDGEMDWQNALTDKNKAYMVDMNMNPLSDSMFLNFWWNTEERKNEELLKSSREKAEVINVESYDLYAGIDVQENGYLTPIQWELFMDKEGVPYTSLGLYVPSWTYASSSTPDEFQDKESMFWINAKGDSTLSELPEEGAWPGISTFALEQTAMTELPFVTNFSLGNGYNYFIKGEKVSSRNWNNRSMQDVMPTYRSRFDHGEGNDLTTMIDYTDAYNGGNSLKLRGQLKADKPSTVKLFATKLTMSSDMLLTTTAKADSETKMQLVLGLDDESTLIIAGDQPVGEEWTTVTFDTNDVVDKVVTSISYELSTAEEVSGYDFRFGQIAIRPSAQDNVIKVTGLAIEDAVFDEEESNYAGVRLIWNEVDSDAVDYYEIYRINSDETRSFLGATPAPNFYLNGLPRMDEINKTDFEVVAVDRFDRRSTASNKVTLEWPDNSIPKTAFIASSTLITPGEVVTFKNRSSSNTESLKWIFEGGDVETSTEDSVQVTYPAGVYTVKLIATNAFGSTELVKKNFITVAEAAEDLTLLSEGSAVEASSFTNDAEAPELSVDGKADTKWCAVGTSPHTISLDLGDVRTVSEVHIDHAEAGGEAANMNTRAYSIEVSEDGQLFTQVVRVVNNEAASTVDTFAAVNARYIRLIVDRPTQESDSAARIYEVGVYGLEAPMN